MLTKNEYNELKLRDEALLLKQLSELGLDDIDEDPGRQHSNSSIKDEYWKNRFEKQASQKETKSQKATPSSPGGRRHGCGITHGRKQSQNTSIALPPSSLEEEVDNPSVPCLALPLEEEEEILNPAHHDQDVNMECKSPFLKIEIPEVKLEGDALIDSLMDLRQIVRKSDLLHKEMAVQGLFAEAFCSLYLQASLLQSIGSRYTLQNKYNPSQYVGLYRRSNEDHLSIIVSQWMNYPTESYKSWDIGVFYFPSTAELTGFIEDESEGMPINFFGSVSGKVLLRNLADVKFSSYLEEGEDDDGVLTEKPILCKGDIGTGHTLFLVEVKASQTKTFSLNISRRELKLAERLGRRYRIITFRNIPTLFEEDGSWNPREIEWTEVPQSHLKKIFQLGFEIRSIAFSFEPECDCIKQFTL